MGKGLNMSESLKIAFYTDTYLPAVDGVVTAIINSKRELERRGHRVSIFTSAESRSRPLTEIEKNVYAVHGIKFKKYPQYRRALFPFLAASKLSQINPHVQHYPVSALAGYRLPDLVAIHARIEYPGVDAVGHYAYVVYLVPLQ